MTTQAARATVRRSARTADTAVTLEQRDRPGPGRPPMTGAQPR